MTLVLNKGEVNTKWVVTTYEMNPITTGSTIELINVATNVNSTYALPTDSSPYPSRYQEYNLTTSDYSGLTAGIYSYVIKDSTSATTETGLLKVINNDDNPVDSYVVLSGSSTDNDYIEYIS